MIPPDVYNLLMKFENVIDAHQALLLDYEKRIQQLERKVKMLESKR